MIYTREQLIHKLEELLYQFDGYGKYNNNRINKYANIIADLIATLGDSEWKNIP